MNPEEAQQILIALRNKLDEVDQELLQTFAQRMQLIREIHRVKSVLGMEVLQEEQFAAGLARRKKEGEGLHLHPEQITGLFDALHQLSVQMQDELRKQ